MMLQAVGCCAQPMQSTCDSDCDCAVSERGATPDSAMDLGYERVVGNPLAAVAPRSVVGTVDTVQEWRGYAYLSQRAHAPPACGRRALLCVWTL